MKFEGENPEVIKADFAEHRREIAQENSPFGPILSGEVVIETHTVPEEPADVPFGYTRAPDGNLIKIYFGTDAQSREYNDYTRKRRGNQ